MILFKHNERIHLFLTGLIAFLIPSFPNVLPAAIGLLIINWLMAPKLIVAGIKKTITSTTLLPIVIVYVLYIIGMFYSSNIQTGLETLETKFSFLILPFIFATHPQTAKDNLTTYLKWFIYGCSANALMCLSYAIYCYIKPVYVDLYGIMYDIGGDNFYYSQLSKFFHPSYIAMYCVFALFAILYLQKKEALEINFNTTGILWSVIMIILILFILLLSSKAGWIGLFGFTTYFTFQLLKTKKVVQASAILIAISSSFYILNIAHQLRFQTRIPKLSVITQTIKGSNEKNEKITTGTEGNGSRILVWKAAIDIIKANFLTGVGTGDAKDTMLETYKQKGMISEYEHKLNSHNQYFNTFIALGIIGFLSLLCSLFIPLYYSFKQQNILFIVFICLAGINFLFESMLERQAGVIYFAYFYSLLCFSLIATNPKSKILNPKSK
ncbi:MAG: O-antigen ligase family protein [Bacteroidia bacterium]